jgi:hypothetical protein
VAEEEEEEAEGDDEDAGVTLLARCTQLPEWGEDFTEVFLPKGQRTVKLLRQALAQEFEVSLAPCMWVVDGFTTLRSQA